MATFNPTTPPLFLSGIISNIVSVDAYPYDDEPTLQNTAFLTYELTVGGIQPQETFSSSVRETNQQYNALDIKVGDYCTDKYGQGVFQIISISDRTTATISFKIKDVDMLSYKVYGSSSILSNGGDLAFFELSDAGAALITGAGINSFFPSALNVDRLQGRFDALLESDSQRFEFDNVQSQISLGDTVTVNLINGSLVRYGSTNSAEIALGIVKEFRMGNTVVYIKPFNKIIDNYPTPSVLTGSFGETYYTDPSNPGKMKTTQDTGALPLFLQIKDATPTVVASKLSNYMPDSNDILDINGVTVYDGNIDSASIVDTDGLVSRLNSLTSTSNVSASKSSEFASISSDVTATSFSTIMNITSSDNGNSYGTIDFQISDGNSTAAISLGDPAVMLSTYGVNVTLVPYPAAPQYLTYDATAMALILNSVFAVDGLNLSATVTDNGETHKILNISATQADASIIITGSDVDDFGQTFAVGSGLVNEDGTATSSDFLIITRADGGDILLTGDNNYWNSNGLNSSSFGSPAMLLMLEGVQDGGGVAEPTLIAIKTKDDLNQTPLVTSNDGDSSGLTITHTPFNDTPVSVEVNGLECNIGDGAKDEACYFSNDGGLTAKTMENIEANDTLYWMGSIAGYQLETSDDVDFNYSKSGYLAE